MFAKYLEIRIGVVFFALFACGCAVKPEEAAKSDGDGPKAIKLKLPTVTPTTSGMRTDLGHIGLPPYPGSKPQQETETVQKMEGFISYAKAYITTDPPKQVAAFYQVECAKLGKLIDLPQSGDTFMTVVVERADGRKSQAVATKMKDGTTSILLTTISKELNPG